MSVADSDLGSVSHSLSQAGLWVATPTVALALVTLLLAPGVCAQTKPRPAVEMTIAVSGGVGDNYAQADLVWETATRSWVVSDMHRVVYQASATPQSITLVPRMKYLSLLAEGGPIEPITYDVQPFRWGFPVIVAQVANNGPKHLAISSAVFEIRSSALDPTPVPVIVPDTFRGNALHFQLDNEGWGDMGDFEAHFNLAPVSKQKSPLPNAPPYAHTVRVGAIERSANIEISAALQKEGVDVTRLPSGLERNVPDDYAAFGKFKGGGAMVVGQFRYSVKTPGGRAEVRTVKFSTPVWLYNMNLVGAPPPPSYDYEAKFEVNGRNYAVTVPVDKTIQPGGRDSISIRVGVAKSSGHDFVLRLRTANATLESLPIHMDVFIPRSGAEHIVGR